MEEIVRKEKKKRFGGGVSGVSERSYQTHGPLSLLG